MPAPETMAFLPQRSYLPLGTLHDGVAYPGPPETFSNAEVRHALDLCDLGNLVTKLDQVERWDKALSLGEQELLVFARLVLHKPSWAFLDEATAALDEDSQHRMMRLFDNEPKRTTVLSIGHRPDLAVYHTRTLQLVHRRNGARVGIKPSVAPPPPRPMMLDRARNILFCPVLQMYACCCSDRPDQASGKCWLNWQERMTL